MLKWNAICRRLFELMDISGDAYFSGGRFIRAVQDFDPDLPNYSEFIEQRRNEGKSTTRRVYFKDILMALDEPTRVRAVNSFLDDLNRVDGLSEQVSGVRALLGGNTLAPVAKIPFTAWNSERLNDYLQEIDAAIAALQYDRAVTLSYTCMEGFLGAFVRAKESRPQYPNELIDLSKDVKALLKKTISEYPDEAVNGITYAAHAVDKARNRFSESHFGGEAGSWLATYVRDLVNTQIRLLLHFM